MIPPNKLISLSQLCDIEASEVSRIKGDESNLKKMKQKLTIFMLVFVVMAILSGCTRKPQLPSIDVYELHCRNLSDNELIAEFYRVDVELQGAVD